MKYWVDYLSKYTMSQAFCIYEYIQELRDDGHIIYPPQTDIFRALKLTKPEDVKVVIIGQDPYHGPGQANGLAFSVGPDVVIPPSLRNILNELNSDIGCEIPTNGDLTKWAKSGILLLNTVLTVEDGEPNSHANFGWQGFVSDVFDVCMKLPQPIVFLLWGKQAKEFISNYDFSEYSNKDYYATSHPSPFSANRGNPSTPAFIGSRPFSTANRLLKSMGGKPVDWRLIDD